MLTLYDYEFSGNGWKVRTLLRHLECPFRIRWLDILRGEQHEPWFLAKNPVAQIPVLEDEHGCVWTESNAILETLAQGSALLPEGHARHQVRAWLNFEQTWVDGVISRARFRRTFPDVVATPPEFFEVWAAEGERALRTLEAHLGSRRYLVADRFTVADIGLYAYVHVAGDAGFRLSEYPARGVAGMHRRAAGRVAPRQQSRGRVASWRLCAQQSRAARRSCHPPRCPYIGEARGIPKLESEPRLECRLHSNWRTTMRHWEHTEIDRRYNELSDSDGIWGPFAAFRPRKDQPFGHGRAFALIAAFCSVYGMLLNFAIAVGSHGHHWPKVYVIPTTLTLILFAAFELTLGPAWNRRASLLARRDRYLAQTRQPD